MNFKSPIIIIYYELIILTLWLKRRPNISMYKAPLLLFHPLLYTLLLKTLWFPRRLFVSLFNRMPYLLNVLIWRRLDGLHIYHQICLILLSIIYLAIKYHLVFFLKSPNILSLKFEHLPIRLYRAVQRNTYICSFDTVNSTQMVLLLSYEYDALFLELYIIWYRNANFVLNSFIKRSICVV